MYYSRNQYKIADISELTGLSTAGIYRILQKHEIVPQRRTANAGQYETIYHFADTGVPAKRIAELSGYSLRQVYNILNSRTQSI
jgi:predicted DNA-binding transcriptional regulator AlpA